MTNPETRQRGEGGVREGGASAPPFCMGGSAAWVCLRWGLHGSSSASGATSEEGRALETRGREGFTPASARPPDTRVWRVRTGPEARQPPSPGKRPGWAASGAARTQPSRPAWAAAHTGAPQAAPVHGAAPAGGGAGVGESHVEVRTRGSSGCTGRRALPAGPVLPPTRYGAVPAPRARGPSRPRRSAPVSVGREPSRTSSEGRLRMPGPVSRIPSPGALGRRTVLLGVPERTQGPGSWVRGLERAVWPGGPDGEDGHSEPRRRRSCGLGGARAFSLNCETAGSLWRP